MSFLGGLISSAAKGLQGGAEAVSALGKAGVEKQIKIDLAKETADIEFEKNKLLKEIDSNLRMEEEKFKRDNPSPVEQATINQANSATDLNKVKKNVEQLTLDVASGRKKDMDTLYQAMKDGNTAVEAAMLEKLSVENNIIGSASRNKRAEIYLKSAEAIADIIQNNPNMDPKEQGKLEKLLLDYLKKSDQSSGGGLISRGMGSKDKTTTSNNTSGGVNTSNPYELLKQPPSDENLEILKTFTLMDQSSRKYRVIDHDGKKYGIEYLDEKKDDKQSFVQPSGKVAQAIAKGKESRNKLFAESQDTTNATVFR